MTPKPQERPVRYTFPNTPAGREQRYRFAEGLTASGITSEASEETMTCPSGTFTLLILTTGKRPGEGEIANYMKGRKFGL